MKSIFTLAFSIAIAALAVAAPQKAIDPENIKDKVSIRLGQELHIQFAHLRLHGEWFRPERELLDFIADVLAPPGRLTS